MPSNSPVLPSAVRSSMRASGTFDGPMSWSRPMSWERCRLRLAMAIWWYDLPTARSSTPPSSVMVVAVLSNRVER